MAVLRQVDDVRAFLGAGGVGLVPLVPAREAGQYAGGVVEVGGVDDEARRGLGVVPLASGEGERERAGSRRAYEVGEAFEHRVEPVAGLKGGTDRGLVVVGVLPLGDVAVAVAVLIEGGAVAGGPFLAGGEQGAQFASQLVVVEGCQRMSRSLEGRYRAVRARGRAARVKAVGCW
ncbi:hypothetical protein F9278_15425 [Streptomyces phaeolivaceus]|uniref:Uncharacterized protein n=1 Tax=Streptomyces phaeolivaceus TaxID=2653200 RepID=A0A5P8K284_9ACTN|nr:hypothetical protein [Streptomyces phaeolivaceus]QFQ97365.1 hypothetical protein F9278_15425 [Streptomyces phaeolivaceus]